MALFNQWQVWPVKTQTGNFMANGKVVIAGTIKCNFKIMKGPKGLFATFPSERVEKEGQPAQYYPHMNLLDDTTKEQFQTEAMEAYNAAVASGGEVDSTPKAPKKNTANIPF